MTTLCNRPHLPAARLLLFGALLLALGWTSARASWWNSDWTLRKKITLDTTATGAAVNDSIGTVTILVRLSDANFRFASVQADGSDLRFIAADDKTPLSYQVEKIDTLLDEAFVWVKVSDLKPSAKTDIWLYYGYNGAKAVKADDAKGTYDENTTLVYHFSENGQPAYDFTGGGANAANAGLASDGAEIGPGLRLDGKTLVTIPDTPALAWTNGASFTWSAWVKPAAAQGRAVVYSRRDNGHSFAIGLENGGPFVEVGGTGGVRRSPAGSALAPGSWHQLAVASAGAVCNLYVDGELYSTVNTPMPTLGGTALLGGDQAGGSPFVGEIDELEISRVERPPGAIRLAAVNQGADGAKFLTFGEDEQRKSWLSGFKTGYVGVIIGSLSVDGWVVIGILAVMFAISSMVMVRKAIYLNRVVRGNVLFLNEWRHVANDLSVLDSADAEQAKSMGGRVEGAGRRSMHAAPLYRVYHIGVEEIQYRLAADQSGAPRVLSSQSIQAIRASLDGGLVRETQKLNAQMVLLTIAISGGPFLGLLGTVVGVMITFAAVAQAGDVNVNAIAPGIAAALAATVAGLGVAIPSLFGYNYLLTRIKSVSTDMHVFIDEFVSKLAEFYSEPGA
jgi:biopolymer transport protein ExbB